MARRLYYTLVVVRIKHINQHENEDFFIAIYKNMQKKIKKLHYVKNNNYHQGRIIAN